MEKKKEYDLHAVVTARNNIVVGRVPQNICDHIWKFLSLPKTSVKEVKETTVVQVIALKLLYASFFKAMSKE